MRDACMVCKGLASCCLCREEDQRWELALWTRLGYSLLLSMVFVLCIIYCCEVSKQISHHIIGHRDPWKNTATVREGGTFNSPAMKKWGTSLAFDPLPCAPRQGRQQCNPAFPFLNFPLGTPLPLSKSLWSQQEAWFKKYIKLKLGWSYVSHIH